MNTEIQDELKTILASDSDGTLKPHAVLEYAKKHKQSAIHQWMKKRGAFDPDKAMQKYGMALARHLIVRVKVWIEDAPEVTTKVRAYSSTLHNRRNGLGYSSTEELITSAEGRRQLILAAKSDMESLKRKYEALSELNRVWEELDRVSA